MNIYRIIDKIKYFPQDIKHAYQRVRKGYSFRDVWGIDEWFMEIMPNMLTDLKENKQGCPIQFVKGDDGQDKDFEEGMRDWHNVLDRMIFCFKEMNDNTCSMKNEYADEYHYQYFDGKPFEDRFIKNEDGKTYSLIEGKVDPELEDNYRKKTLELEEYKDKMKNEGFELFSKYFGNLWD
jgi:hypothetical protein